MLNVLFIEPEYEIIQTFKEQLDDLDGDVSIAIEVAPLTENADSTITIKVMLSSKDGTKNDLTIEITSSIDDLITQIARTKNAFDVIIIRNHVTSYRAGRELVSQLRKLGDNTTQVFLLGAQHVGVDHTDKNTVCIEGRCNFRIPIDQILERAAPPQIRS